MDSIASRLLKACHTGWAQPRVLVRIGVLALASVVLREAAAQPFFEAGHAVGNATAILSVPIHVDTGGAGNVVSGSMVVTYDNGVLTATEDCRSLLGFQFGTHNVDCVVNAGAGEITVGFDSIMPLDNILLGRHRLGELEFEVGTGAGPFPDLATLPLNVTAVAFADGDDNAVAAGDGVDGSLRLLDTWPIDEYEPDDLPILATPGISPSGMVTQLHGFHDAGDEDWIAFDAGGGCSFVDLVLTVRPVNGDDGPEEFVPVVEVYDARRFTLLVPPVLTYGECSGQTGPVSITTPTNDILESSLVRIRNCGPPPLAGLAYDLLAQYGEVCPSDATLVKGKVIEEGTNAPVSVFVMTDLNVFTISSLSSGSYDLAALANQGFTITIASPLYTADPLAIPPIPPGETSIDNDIVVRRIDRIFGSGFE